MHQCCASRRAWRSPVNKVDSRSILSCIMHLIAWFRSCSRSSLSSAVILSSGGDGDAAVDPKGQMEPRALGGAVLAACLSTSSRRYLSSVERSDCLTRGSLASRSSLVRASFWASRLATVFSPSPAPSATGMPSSRSSASRSFFFRLLTSASRRSARPSVTGTSAECHRSCSSSLLNKRDLSLSRRGAIRKKQETGLPLSTAARVGNQSHVVFHVVRTGMYQNFIAANLACMAGLGEEH